MLLDDRGAHDHAGDRGGVVEGVVGQASDQAEALDHVGDGAQVVVLRRGRVAAHAVEDGEFLAAALVRGLDGFLGLPGVGLPCIAGDGDHGFALPFR